MNKDILHVKDEKSPFEKQYDKTSIFLLNLFKDLNNDEFFRKIGNYKIISIQDYGRKSKFKIQTENKLYTLILTDKRIQPYVIKMEQLGEYFKKLVGFRYLSKDQKILVLDYYGQGDGIDIVKLEKNGFNVDDDTYIKQFKTIIDNFHSTRVNYTNLDSKTYFSTWDDYYISQIKEKIINIYEKGIIDNKTYENLLVQLYNSANISKKRETCFIHSDITPLNVCINPLTKKLYLIDYDDFKIGDSLMDISRIINCQNMSKLFKKMTNLYYKEYETDLNHLFYTLRVQVNWYNYIIKKHQEKIYNLDNAKLDVLNTIKEILENK